MTARLHLNYHCIYQMIITREGIGRKGLVNRCHYDLRKYFFSNRIIMRPSSLGGGRILRRTLSVCPSVRLTVRPVIITERHVAPPSELQ